MKFQKMFTDSMIEDEINYVNENSDFDALDMAYLTEDEMNYLQYNNLLSESLEVKFKTAAHSFHSKVIAPLYNKLKSLILQIKTVDSAKEKTRLQRMIIEIRRRIQTVNAIEIRRRIHNFTAKFKKNRLTPHEDVGMAGESFDMFSLDGMYLTESEINFLYENDLLLEDAGVKKVIDAIKSKVAPLYAKLKSYIHQIKTATTSEEKTRLQRFVIEIRRRISNFAGHFKKRNPEFPEHHDENFNLSDLDSAFLTESEIRFLYENDLLLEDEEY